MKYLSVLSLVALSLCPLAAYGELTTEVRCFRSSEGKNINFEFRTYHDSVSTWGGVGVRYRQSKRFITLVHRNTEQEILAEDRPYEFTTTWVELSEGALTGEYEMVSQGARVYSMVYTNYKSGKKYSFEEDFGIDFSPETGCQW
mgnify:CR=1 FL=1